ncbi:MAG: hypothetical protein C0605_05690 [Hyphomicrobiales bacterium]|nr:MAG: hypothetical protein C0605_05690 [Hyphomicrobiales bacterium]
MPAKQPTFIQRIRLLEYCSHIVDGYAQDFIAEATHGDFEKLSEVADLLNDEVVRMKAANERFEKKRQARKTGTKKAPVKALHRVADEACGACQ